jgi:glyoxylase-like metal-dependent hydrolase (beta-lactamase superfamily II)
MATTTWTEIAENVFAKRYDPVDVTVTAVVGEEGVLVVDTRCSLAEGREVRDELGKLTPRPIRWVVNTHGHWDHVWGNAEFDTPRMVPPAEFWGHENLPDFEEEFREAKDQMAGQGPEWAIKMAELELRKPDRLVGAFHRLDLGGRTVDLHHLGRGHTGADLVLWLPDVDLLVAGDLLEESGPPAYGSDSFPMDWPDTVERIAELTEGDALYVPSHGETVPHAFVMAQLEYVRSVREQISELYHSGVPVDKALAAGSWPHPKAEVFGEAVGRGYAQLSGELP